ncbi:LTA synthase family protein [Lacticigenium naphthae]|uniref:LTA synthase family protein n=1 Tax=Lacticigenium naphthae TaxID=515351 RepID=UPI0004270A89|nr:LTA synthase family protein [Lacticigenium naphthae]
MIKKKSSLPLLIYFVLSLFFLEFVLRLRVDGDSTFISMSLFISFIFSLILAIALFLLSSLFRNRTNYILSFVFLIIAGSIFSTQFVYFQFFRTFYSFYSTGNVSQIFEFRQDIWTVISNNYSLIILFYLPALFLLFFGKKLFRFNKISELYRSFLICLIIIFHITGLTTIWFNGKNQNSAYDLYFQTRDPILSVDRLGLITTMRLDFQRLATGWSPTQTIPDMPVSNSESIYESDKEDDEDEQLKEIDESEIVEKEIDYNMLDIDFDKLISTENDETIKQMHNYFANVEPTAKNEYTGKYEGYNLIFLTAEGFSPYAVNEELTPTLFKMVHEGYNFTDFYVPLWDVSTSDGEYVSLTSLIPKSGIWSFSASAKIDLPFVMGNQFKELGYKTVAYHNHTYSYYDRDASHPNMGYDYTGVGNGLDMSGGWPASDLEMMQETIPQYIADEPFHAYYMTVSGHMQYSFSGNNIAYKNKEYVKDLSYSEQAQAYLATQIELDKALENMLNQLEEADMAEETLIVLATDHYPYGLDNSTIDELAGHPVDRDFELYKSPLIIYTKGMDPVTVDKPSSNLDIIPTLSNLLGLEFDSRLVMGSDIFSDSSPLVMFRNKSFITEKGKYNSATKQFSPTEDNSNQDYTEHIDTISLSVDNKFYYSGKILETDYYKGFK